MDVFTLYGNIVINEKDVTKSLDSVDSKVKETGGVFSSIGKSVIGGFAMGVGSAIFDNIIGGLKSAVTVGWDFNSMMENATSEFGVMLNSAEKAKKLMADLQKMGANTPFELKDLTSATKTLMGFGVQLKDVLPTLGRLGDIAGGDANKLQSLALVFGQVKAAGKAMSGDIYQLINAGFAPLEGIAKRLKIPLSEVKTAIEQGKVSFEVLNDVIVTSTSKGGMFYQSMEKASKTMSGQWSTLKDNVSSTMGKVLAPAFNYMSTVVLPKLNNAFSNSGDTVKNAIDKMGQVLSWIKDNVIPALITTFNTLAPIVKTIFNGIGEAINWIKTNVIPPLISAFNTISPIVTEMFNNIIIIARPILYALKQLFDVIFPYIKDIVMTAFNFIKGLLLGFVDSVRGILNFLAGIVQGDFQKAMKGAGQFLSGLFNGILSIFKGVINTIITGLNLIVRSVNKVSSFVPGMGAKGLGIPTIPLMAKGGNIAQSGMAVVGEAGAELVNLPKGASVTPLDKAMGVVININNPKLFNQNDVDKMMIPVLKKLRYQGIKGGI